jgi:glycolate oxidase iron-sulfur subunit
MIPDLELSSHARDALFEVEKCTSCGLCKDVCPVFLLSLREAESPRGKINLLRALMEERLDPGAGAVDVFNRCLLCYACQDACPAGVRTERIWISARESLADEVGRPLAKSLFLRKVLTQPRLLNLALGFARRIPGSGQAVRLNRLQLPRPSTDRLDQLLPEVVEPRTELVGTVAFFPGCMLSEVFPHLGLKTAEILAHLGYRVIMPEDRACCGAPAFNNGDLSTGRSLAEKNLKVFAHMDVDAVVSPDATCGGAFQHEYDFLFPVGSLWRKTYLDFREKVADFGEFLLRVLKNRSDPGLKHMAGNVALHDSCHLSHLQQRSEVPRQVLALIPGLLVVDSPRSELCCGFGGSYSAFFPAESRAIARRKLDFLMSSNSKTIVVGSPGCLWKLRREAAELALDVRVIHYLELFWESLLGSGGLAPTSAKDYPKSKENGSDAN